MKRMLLFTALLCGTLFPAKAQKNVSEMDNQSTKTIRLVYPQWQGGDIAHWITEVKDPEQASRGYYLGAQLLNFLAPDSGQETYTVPVATDKIERKVTDGVLGKEALIAQTRAALDILKITHPDKIVTLGGECSASVVPFTYLADKYKDDVAMVWIDAHPDITLPGDVYAGYHAMAVTACMGLGDKQLVAESNGGWNKTSTLSFLNMPILSYAGEIRTAVLLVHGGKAHSRYFSEDTYKKLTGDNKELLIIPGANHTDLYDNFDKIPFDKIAVFYRANLK